MSLIITRKIENNTTEYYTVENNHTIYINIYYTYLQFNKIIDKLNEVENNYNSIGFKSKIDKEIIQQTNKSIKFIKENKNNFTKERIRQIGLFNELVDITSKCISSADIQSKNSLWQNKYMEYQKFNYNSNIICQYLNIYQTACNLLDS
jgi:hypothetical protein